MSPSPSSSERRGAAAELRDLLRAPGPTYLMEAHDGLSARIASEAGFDALWASSLTMSAAMGLRDRNEASWTQVLAVAEQIVDGASAPVLVDGDSGHGDFNNTRRLARKLAQRGVAGLCIEDKLFPKENSLRLHCPQQLADRDEFCGKLRAVRDEVAPGELVLVARTEALIAGAGLDEALARARAYQRAGVDAIFVHSRRQDPSEILAFMAAWDQDTPVLIAPTAFEQLDAAEFEDLGVQGVIWANQLLRASIQAMQQAAARVRTSRCVQGLGETMVPVAEVFRLQDCDELEQARSRYIPGGDP